MIPDRGAAGSFERSQRHDISVIVPTIMTLKKNSPTTWYQCTVCRSKVYTFNESSSTKASEASSIIIIIINDKALIFSYGGMCATGVTPFTYHCTQFVSWVR